MRPRKPKGTVSPVFTVVINHPTNRPGREQMIEQVRHVSELYGGRVTQISEIDGLALVQRLSDRLGPDDVEAAQREAGVSKDQRDH